MGRKALVVGLSLVVMTAVAIPAGFILSAQAQSPAVSQTQTRTSTFTAEVWADNWFALYVNGKKVGQDSVPITTERSFNAETITFTATYPLTIGIIGKDYVANASGLEYIGTPRQQIGDGGLIAQIRDNQTGKIVAATDGSWKIDVIQEAPLNPECVTSSDPLTQCQSRSIPKPAKWSTTATTSWSKATTYTPEAVGVKEGYLTIAWDPRASLVWGPDLKLDNTILLRTTVS